MNEETIQPQRRHCQGCKDLYELDEILVVEIQHATWSSSSWWVVCETCAGALLLFADRTLPGYVAYYHGS